MTIKHRILIIFIKFFKLFPILFGRKFYWEFMSAFIENLKCVYVATVGCDYCKFRIISNLTYFRAKTLLTKEPETIRWMDSFPKDSVMLDIGANIGTYTVYAARICRAKVIAIEPSPPNYATLICNIAENSIEDRVYPICAAAGLDTKFSQLHRHYGGIVAGGSGVIFDSNRINDNEIINQIDKIYSMGISIDHLLDFPGIPFPNYLKLDVIGTQDDVLNGALKLLSDERLVGAMIEMPELDDSKFQICMSIVKDSGLMECENFKSNNPTEFFFVRS
ncbi:MAG: FkbM family methyltransferase [Rhodospirillales bacterium]